MKQIVSSILKQDDPAFHQVLPQIVDQVYSQLRFQRHLDRARSQMWEQIHEDIYTQRRTALKRKDKTE